MQAERWWVDHGLSGRDDTLGVHLRGSDKGRRIKHADAYMGLITAYLCARPAAHVLLATDDERLLTEMRGNLSALLPDGRVLWREALRSNS